MPFSILDIILVLLLVVFAWKGYKQGLIEALASLFSIMIGLYVAARFYSIGATWLMHWTGWGQTFSRVLVFIAIFIVINRLVSYLFYLADRFLQLIFRLPFIRLLNHLLGAFLAILEGVIILTVLIFIFKYIPINSTATKAVNNSIVSSYLIKTSSFVWPFLPNVAKNLL